MDRYVISAAHTWLGRRSSSCATYRDRFCGRAPSLVVFGLGLSAAMPILRINRCTRLRLTRSPSAFSIAVIRHEPRNGRR